MGIGDPFYNTLRRIYNKNTGSVRSLNVLSASFPIEKGVHKGDILRPLLYNLFINDLVNECKRHECTPPELIVGSLLDADDLVIISITSSGLQV